MPKVNPEILVWARQTAGLSPGRAVVALGLKDGHKHRAVERLAALETGQEEPSRALLLKMSQKYRRPLLAFYLPRAPKQGDRGEDFRSIPDKQTDSESLVDALVRDVHARQAAVRDLLLDEDPDHRLPFIASARMTDGVDNVLASIRKDIGIELAEYRAQPSPERAFSLLRERVEVAGIFVLLIGNLGSHHTAVNVEAFRGFALADNVAPFVVINDQDSPSAWSFTLLHELVHLWLGRTGVSGRQAELELEKFCNDVAAAFLLPQRELLELIPISHGPTARLIDSINSFAIERNISRTMVSYSLYRASIIDKDTWQTITAWFLNQWQKNRVAKRERRKDKIGPNYYVVRRHRLGHALLHLVARNLAEGALTPTRASKVLGVKPRSVAPLLSSVLVSDAA